MTPEQIIHLRKNKLKLTQQAFATRIGVSISTVARWEAGTTEDISPLAREKLEQLKKEAK